jgi:hypothetical protein
MVLDNAKKSLAVQEVFFSYLNEHFIRFKAGRGNWDKQLC